MRGGSGILGVVAALLLALLTAEAAVAFPAGTTTLITRPAGDLPLVALPTGRSALFDVTDGALQGGHQTSQDGRYVVFVSEADALSTLDVDTVKNVYVRDTQTDETELVSRSSGAGGTGGNGQSDNPAISDDGTRVVFTSTAQLDPADMTANSLDLYVRDLTTDAIHLLPDSLSPFNPSIDADGSHVAFATQTAFDATHDTNGGYDVYVWQVGTATYELASRLTGAGTAALTGDSIRSSLSDDGATVAFETDSEQLSGDGNGVTDIAVRRLSTAAVSPNVTVLASRESGASGTVGDGPSTVPALSGDGTRIAFVSEATNLLGAGNDTNGTRDVFRRALVAATTVRVSVSDGEAQLTDVTGSRKPSISDDGTRVTFTNFGTGIAADDGTGTTERVFVRDVAAGTTTVASRADGTGAGAPGLKAGANAISGDGHSVAFAGTNPGYTPDDDDDLSRNPHVYVRRLASHPTAPDTTRFLDRPTGTAPFTGASDVDDAQIHPGSVSWDGRYVGFASDADNLVPGQDNGVRNGFVRDTVAGTIELLTATPAGSTRVALSADGRTAAFVGGDALLHVRDLDTDADVIASRADGAAGATTPVQPSAIAISGDGRRVAFVTSAALDPADANGANDVYVRDLDAADTLLASRADDEQDADGASDAPALDWDGSVVAFETLATNLRGPGGDGNGVRDVAVRDLEAGTTLLASRADGAAGALGNAASRAPTLDGDGARVAFASDALNLGGAGLDVYVRDLATADTTAFGGTAGDGQPAISEDGQRVAFVSADVLDPADTTSSADVYVRTPGSPTATLVSRANGVGGAVGNLASGGNSVAAEGPAISGNGQCVVFPSPANNLDPDWTGSGVTLGYLRTTGASCPDTAPPATTIDSGPAGTTTDTTPTFTFSADERRARFECSIDGGAFVPCATPYTTPSLTGGAHALRVRATDVPGNTDATPEERAFTVEVPAPPPAPPAPPADPATPLAPVAPAAAAPTPKDPAKLKVLRAGVERGVLDVLVEITSGAVTAGADLDVAYESSGRTTRFSVPLSSGRAARRGPVARAAEQRITIRRTLPATQPKATGIVSVAYAGNDRVQPDEVRLRAAAVKALLARKGTSLVNGRLKVDGTISAKARGVVRVRLGFARADGSTGFETFNATIADGAWKVDRTLSGDAAKGGYLSIQFTGYEAAGMRGEQTGKAVP